MSPAGTSLERIDARLEELRATVARIGARLVSLDGDATRKLLETSTLTGATAVAWSDAVRAISLLWQDHAALSDLLREVSDRRQSKRRPAEADVARMTHLLFDPAVAGVASGDPDGVGAAGLPAQLLAGETPQAPARSADQVVAAMVDGWASVSDTLTRVGAVWDQLLPRLAGMDAALEQAQAEATGAGARLPNELTATRRRLSELRAAAFADPLSIDAAAADGLARDIERLCAELAGAAQANRSLDRTAAALGAQLETIAALLAGALLVAEESEAKLARWRGPTDDLRRARGDLASLRDELSAAIAGSAGLDATARRLSSLQRKSAALLGESQTLASVCREGLAARAELRGRLAAYRARAGATGRGEDLALDAMFREAESQLHQAPCDLQHASMLVRRYQDAVRQTAPTDAR